MALKFKKKFIGLFDMLRFKKMVDKRRGFLLSGSLDKINNTDGVNNVANEIHHPRKQFIVSEIIKLNNSFKIFRFKPVDGLKLAFFNPGQYISILIDSRDFVCTRPYSLTSSPKETITNNYYEVTIKRDPNGLFSNYMFNKIKVGSKVYISSPCGNFTFNPIRDSKQVVAIAGGSGVTPFVSMAKAIEDGTLSNVNMTLFYGYKNAKEGIWIKKLQEIASKTNNFKLIQVIEEKTTGVKEIGRITRKLINKYIGKQKYMVMACGSKAFNNYLFKEFKDFKSKDIRVEEPIINWRTISKTKKFNIKVYIRDEVFKITCLNSQTILSALEQFKINAPNHCRTGHCGFCHAKCLSGKYTMVVSSGQRKADIDFNYFHPCCSYPESDMEIIINYEK